VTARRLFAGLAACLLLAACAPTSESAPKVDLVVFAASSLNPAFADVATAFQADHPGVTVKLSYDGSSALLDDLKAGARADVFASADTSTMDRATSAGLMTGTAVQFTTNILTLITPAGNPAGITGLDASLAGKKLVICAEGVPCGTATKKLATALGVALKPVSEETKVTDVRTKVESGQADAGIVYVTDAKASGDKVQRIAITGADKARNQYLIGVPNAATHASLAADFISFVTSGTAQQILKTAGFGG
jgi:molybdate transport system substrate-binding protein